MVRIMSPDPQGTGSSPKKAMLQPAPSWEFLLPSLADPKGDPDSRGARMVLKTEGLLKGTEPEGEGQKVHRGVGRAALYFLLWWAES